jgi:hypothetical protein
MVTAGSAFAFRSFTDHQHIFWHCSQHCGALMASVAAIKVVRIVVFIAPDLKGCVRQRKTVKTIVKKGNWRRSVAQSATIRC